MADFVRVASTDDIPEGEMAIVQAGGEEIVVANVAGEFFAFNSTCTHRGGPLGEGTLESDVVECPWHQGRFNVRTGEVISGPPKEPVRVYPVRVSGKDIEVAPG